MPIDPANLAATAVLPFSDEFNTLNLWNGRAGTWATAMPQHPLRPGGNLPTNGEKQWYINHLYPKTAAIRPWSVKDGVLSLTAAKAPPPIRRLIENHRYTSGYIATYPSYNTTYGYFEIRAQLPKGQGYWPAF